MASRTTYYRRKRRAKELGCSPDELPDLRGKHGHQARCSDHPRWREGISHSSHGYMKVSVGKDHPLADPNGYAYLHLLVWVAAGNPIPQTGEVIHHIDEDKTNNRYENLELKTSSEHISAHNRNRAQLSKLVHMPELDGRVWDQYPEVK